MLQFRLFLGTPSYATYFGVEHQPVEWSVNPIKTVVTNRGLWIISFEEYKKLKHWKSKK
jgi:hypothetical protein